MTKTSVSLGETEAHPHHLRTPVLYTEGDGPPAVAAEGMSTGLLGGWVLVHRWAVLLPHWRRSGSS